MSDPQSGTNANPPEEEMSEEEMIEEEGEERREFVDKLMKDPQVLAALQTKLRRFLGTPSSYISVSCIYFNSARVCRQTHPRFVEKKVPVGLESTLIKFCFCSLCQQW